MTINEIQSTLDQLKQRHPGLDESLISTLLEAGGWDQKEITEAKMLFKAQAKGGALPHEDQIFLPEQPELLLEEHAKATDEVHQASPLEEPVPMVSVPAGEVPTREKESLVVEDGIDHDETPIPHNLPLKPFEASPHVWQFSRYKDVFYGNTPSKIEPKEIVAEKVKDVPVIKITEAIPAVTPAPVKVPKANLAKVPLSKGDEGIIALGAMLALIVVLLALYMYSQGRL